MQQSRRRFGYLWPLLAVGCGGFAPRDYGANASARAAGGIAGFSYDAGAPEGGKASVSPPSSKPNDWRPLEPSGGESGAPDDLGITPPTRHSETDGGAAGESGDGTAGSAGAGRASGAAGRAAGGQGSGSGAGGHAGRGGATGYGGGATYGGANGHGGGAGGQAARGGSSGSSGSSGGTGGASSGGTGARGGAGTTGGGGGSPALFFSEYVEGGHKDKALELRARVAASLDGCRIVIYSNGHTDVTENATALEGNLRTGDTYVLCNSGLAEALGATCNRSANLTFNGNDAITLECDGTVVDAIGQVGFDPKPAWSVAGVSTIDQTLRRRCSITQGDAFATDAFDPSVEWASHPVDDFSGLGSPDCD